MTSGLFLKIDFLIVNLDLYFNMNQDYIETIEDEIDFENITDDTNGLDLYLDYYDGNFPDNLKFLSICGEVNLNKLPNSLTELYLTYLRKNPNYRYQDLKNLERLCNLKKLVLHDISLEKIILPNSLKSLSLEYSSIEFYSSKDLENLPTNLENLVLKIKDDNIQIPKLNHLNYLKKIEIILKYSNKITLENLCQLIPLTLESMNNDNESDEIIFCFENIHFSS